MYITRESLYKNPKSKFILIKDFAQVSGIKLMRGILNTILKENVKLHIINYEIMNISLISEQNCVKDVTKVDVAQELMRWNGAEGGLQNIMSLSVLSNLCSEFKGVICFDSLTPLLLFNDVNSVYKALHKTLKNNDLQIVALLHQDVHSAIENDIIERLATTVLRVMPDDVNKCQTVVRYSNGKVSKQIVEYNLSDTFEFSVFREFIPPKQPEPSKQPDPTANLTFNLRLKEDEKEARNSVQLPYMQAQNEDAVEMAMYMYDEEDPDDDLDF